MAGSCVANKSGESLADLRWRRCLHDAHNIRRILVAHTVWLPLLESVVELVGFGDQECCHSCHFRLDRPVICGVERRAKDRGVVDQNGFQAWNLTSRPFPVGSQPCATTASTVCHAPGDDQVHGDQVGPAVDLDWGHPDPGFDVTPRLGHHQGESGLFHGLFERGIVSEERWIECKVTVGRIGSD